MISAEELYRILHRKPFKPFRVYLKDGQTFDIRYPRNNIVGVDYFVIGIPATEDPEFIAERTLRVSLDLIDRAEDLEQATTPAQS
jgi:hypothetical protein